MLTASDMRMHHVLIILTLTFIQGYTDLNHENNKCSIISDCSSNAHHVCCKDSPKGQYDHCQTNDLDLDSRSQQHLKLDYFLMCNISDNNYATSFTFGMPVDIMHGIYSCSFWWPWPWQRFKGTSFLLQVPPLEFGISHSRTGGASAKIHGANFKTSQPKFLPWLLFSELDLSVSFRCTC